MPAGDRAGEQLALRGNLRAGVPGANHHERAPRIALDTALGSDGEFDLPDQVVTQVQRLADTAESVRVQRHSGHGQQLVDAARGDQQAVVAHRSPIAFRVDEPELPGVEVDAVNRAEYQPGTGARGAQRHRDLARVENACGHLGQQRQVEEVVIRIDQDDLEGAVHASADPGETTGGVQSGEAGADDHYPDSLGIGVHWVSPIDEAKGAPRSRGLVDEAQRDQRQAQVADLHEHAV